MDDKKKLEDEIKKLKEENEKLKSAQTKTITKSEVIKRLRENYYEFSADSVNEEFRKDLEAINFDLSEADLSKADLSKANLWEADLSEADLSEANLWEADYYGTNFWNCKVTKKVKEQIISMIEFQEVDG